MPTALQLLGKRSRRREEEELNTLPVGGSLIYLRDKLTNRDFLVDTGASRSVFPHQSAAPPSGPRLLMADGQSVRASRPDRTWLKPSPVQTPFSTQRWDQQIHLYIISDIHSVYLYPVYICRRHRKLYITMRGS